MSRSPLSQSGSQARERDEGPAVTGTTEALRIRLPGEMLELAAGSSDPVLPTVPEPDEPPQLTVDPTDPASLNAAGQAYLLGEGVPQDEARGHELLMKAAFEGEGDV